MSETRTDRAEIARGRLATNLGFALAAVLAVAMGVGLNAAIFSGSLQSPGFTGLKLNAETLDPGAAIGVEKVEPAAATAACENEPDRQNLSPRHLAAAAKLKQSRLSSLWNKSGPVLRSQITSSLLTARNAAEDIIRRTILSLFREMPIADKNKNHSCGD